MIKKLKIGNVELNNNLIFAPLAGYSDVGFRYLCRKYGAGLTVTEMISTKALLRAGKQTKLLLSREKEEVPCAVQLFGKEVSDFENAVKNPLLKDFEIIDINMGCPAQKVVKSGSGSALLKNISLAENIIRACVENTDKPVTVKFRIGFDNDNLIALEFSKMCERAGASAITIHGRTREQMYSGVANWDIIKECAEAVSIPVIANGDISSINDIEKIMSDSKVAGVMIGRSALGFPQLFSILQNKEVKIDKLETIKEHINILLKYFPEKYVIVNMRKHICFYLKGERNSSETRAKVVRIDNFNELYQELALFFNN